MKKPKSLNKMTQFCTEFMNLNGSSSKENPLQQFGSHQKPVKSFDDYSQEKVKFYEFRTGSKTSHEKDRPIMNKLPGASTPTAFFYKPTKISNKNMLSKRNSVTTADSVSQKNKITGIKKMSARMIHRVSRSNIDKFWQDEVILQNERMR